MELSLAEATGWFALLVFICGWFFVLGILVGRGLVTVPEESESFKKFFAEARQSPPDERPATPAEPVPAVKPPAAPSERNAPAVQAPPSPAAEKPKKSPAAPPVEKEETGEKPQDFKGKIFTIQVAAVRDQPSADRFLDALKKKKYAPYIVKATPSDGVTWYRLRCGAFSDRAEAAPVLDQLRKDGFSPILVRR